MRGRGSVHAQASLLTLLGVSSVVRMTILLNDSSFPFAARRRRAAVGLSPTRGGRAHAVTGFPDRTSMKPNAATMKTRPAITMTSPTIIDVCATPARSSFALRRPALRLHRLEHAIRIDL